MDPNDIDPGLAALREGIALYNRGEFFEAHEVLEEPWRRLEGFDRDLYQGLIKLAAAFHHAGRGKPRSAFLLLRRARLQLAPLVGRPGPVPLEALLREIEPWLDRFERGDAGPLDGDAVPRLPDPRS
jgi:hypothetical protein